MNISISMITLNEQDNIIRALSSCTFADEIVVVDGGSKDGTVDILRENPKVKVIENRWDGHFGNQRQLSLDHCKGDWVIRLDADEAFSEELEFKIRDILLNTERDVFGYKIRQCNLIGNEAFYSGLWDDYEKIPRIWRRLPSIRWRGRIHERLACNHENRRILDLYVVHYGFLDKDRLWEKGKKYAGIDGSGIDLPEQLVYRDCDLQPRPFRSRVGPHVPPYRVRNLDDGLSNIAIIRGFNLNKWEMQNYEPLASRYSITAYTTTLPNFDLSKISIPVVKLPSNNDNRALMVGLEGELVGKDLVYTADITWPFSYQAAVARNRIGFKLVCLEWENIPFAYEESEDIRRMKCLVRGEADHFVAVTERAKTALMIEGVAEDKITVIPMGIDINRFRPMSRRMRSLKKREGLDEDELVLLFIGRMVWEKGIYDLVHAMKLLLERQDIKDNRLRLLMVGKGVESEGLKKRIGLLGITDNVTLIDEWPYHRMQELHNIADIFILPSVPLKNWQEQFGMVLIEAMACGKPVISTNSGSIPEVVGDCGILVQPNDPFSLSDSIATLIKEEEMRRRLSLKARRRVVNKFDSRKIADKVGKLFDRLLLIKSDKDYAREVYAEGIRLWDAGHKMKAIENIEKSLRLYEEHREAIKSLVWMEREISCDGLSRSYLNRYLMLHPGDTEIMVIFAEELMRHGRVEEAVERAESILLFDAGNTQANELIRRAMSERYQERGQDKRGS